MFGLFGKGVDKRLDDIEQTLQSSVENMRNEQMLVRQWVAYLHGEQQRQRLLPSPQQAGSQGPMQKPLTEEQVRTIVEKHAAFDILLDKISGIENRISNLSVPAASAGRLDELQRTVVSEVSRTLAASEAAIAERLEGELKETEGRLRASESELRGFVDSRLSEVREELESENERRVVMLASRIESLEKAGPTVSADESTLSAIEALRERVSRLEERPVPDQNAPGQTLRLSDEELARLAALEQRVDSSFVKIAENLQEGGVRIHAIEESMSQLGERLQATRHELLSSIAAMAERVQRIEGMPLQQQVQPVLHQGSFAPPLNLQLPPPPAYPQPVVFQPPAPVVQLPAQSRLQQKLLRQISKHPKAVVKSAILTLIQKYGRLAGTELRDMVVDEQQLCSKSSFYRLLEELEKEGHISIAGDGKEKTLLPAEHKRRRIEER